MNKKHFRLPFTILQICVCSHIFAQDISKLTNTLNTTAASMTSFFDPVYKICCVICAVLGIGTAVEVYKKFQSKDHEASSSLMTWGGGLIFFIVATSAIKLLLLS